MNRQQRRMQEKYQQAMERGVWVEQKPDPDEKYVIISFRIPNGGMPTDQYEGKAAVDRLDRFCRGFTQGVDDGRRGAPYRRGDPMHLEAALGGSVENWWQRLLHSKEVDRGIWWSQKADPADPRFVLVEMRMPSDGGRPVRLTGLAARDELERFCRKRLADIAAQSETH